MCEDRRFSLALFKAGDTCVMAFQPMRPLCIEPFSEFPALGRFSIRDMRFTVGVGVVRTVQNRDGDVFGHAEDDESAPLKFAKSAAKRK